MSFVVLAVVITIVIGAVYVSQRPKSAAELRQAHTNALIVNTHSPNNHLCSATYNANVGVSSARIRNDALGYHKTVYAERSWNLEHLVELIFYQWYRQEMDSFSYSKMQGTIDESKLFPIFIYKQFDVKGLVSGQEVILVDDKPTHVYNYDGDIIGMAYSPYYISTYPLGLARIVVKDGKYFLYADPYLKYRKPLESTFVEMEDFVVVESYDNYFHNLEIDRSINDPDDYADKKDQKRNSTDYEDLTVEVSYNVPWMDATDDDCEINLSKMEIKRLLKAEERGEELTHEYISSHMKSIHKKILKAIRNDMEEKSWDPDDGMVTEHYPPCFTRKVKVHDSHEDMLYDAEDEDIEYFVTIY